MKAFILRLRERKLLIGRVSSVGGEEGALVLHQSGGGLVHHVEVTGLAGQLTPVGLDVRRDALHQFLKSEYKTSVKPVQRTKLTSFNDPLLVAR